MGPSERRDSSHAKWLSWAIVGCLLVAVAIVYGQTLAFGFLGYDDQFFITGCPPVKAGLTGHGVWWAFTNGPVGNWYPLAMLSHMLDCQVYGLDHPAGHFLTNLLLHGATVIGLLLVLRRMTGELWPSAVVAALLAVHPQHVESVAWLAERRDVLCGFFFVLTLAAYLGYVRHDRSAGRYLLTAALLALGLMAKAMLVTVPCLLLLLDYWPLRRLGGLGTAEAGWSDAADDLVRRGRTLPPEAGPAQTPRSLVLEKIPLLAIALADCAITFVSQVPAAPRTWSERLSNAALSLVTYLAHCFDPVHLAAFYPYAAEDQPPWKAAAAVALLALISLAVVVDRRRAPYLFVGWFWFLGMLTPVLGLVQVANHGMADRYMYLPAIGLYVAVVWSAWRLSAGSIAGRCVFAAGAMAAIVVLTVLATRQVTYWHDLESLWNHAITVTGPTAQAESGLAEAIRRSGRLEEALEHYRIAAELLPDSETFNNYGMVLYQLGKLDEAEAEYRLGLALDPDSPLLLGNLGAVRAQQGKPDEAYSLYSRAIAGDPTALDPYLNMVRLLGQQGRYDEALVFCRQALEVDPDNALARQMLIDLEKARSRKPAK